MRIFATDGPLMTALGKLTDIVLCNMLFCLLSLPLFTAGAALTGLYACMQSLADNREEAVVVRQFWRVFCKKFKSATLLWLACLGAAAFLLAFYWAVSFLSGALGRVYRVTFLALCFVFYLGFQYLFPLLAAYPMKGKQALKNAWLLSAAALPWSLLGLALTAAAVYITWFMNPEGFNMSVAVTAFGFFGVLAYLKSFLFRQAFKRIRPL